MDDEFNFESVSRFGSSYLYKCSIEGTYDSLFTKFEKDLSDYNDNFHELNIQGLLELLADIEHIESCLPLPIYLKGEIIKSRIPGDRETIHVKSYENDRRRIVETVATLKQRVIRRLIDIDPDIQNTLISRIQGEKEISSTPLNTLRKSLTASPAKNSKKDSAIFSQIINPDHLAFLIKTYKGCESKNIVPMLYAITDLGLLGKVAVFNNQTRLYKELQELFNFKDTRQSLNQSISAHNKPNSKQREAIKRCKVEFSGFQGN